MRARGGGAGGTSDCDLSVRSRGRGQSETLEIASRFSELWVIRGLSSEPFKKAKFKACQHGMSTNTQRTSNVARYHHRFAVTSNMAPKAWSTALCSVPRQAMVSPPARRPNTPTPCHLHRHKQTHLHAAARPYHLSSATPPPPPLLSQAVDGASARAQAPLSAAAPPPSSVGLGLALAHALQQLVRVWLRIRVDVPYKGWT